MHTWEPVHRCPTSSCSLGPDPSRSLCYQLFALLHPTALGYGSAVVTANEVRCGTMTAGANGTESVSVTAIVIVIVNVSVAGIGDVAATETMNVNQNVSGAEKTRRLRLQNRTSYVLGWDSSHYACDAKMNGDYQMD